MRIVSGASEEISPDLFFNILNYRHRVFVEILQWNIHTESETEFDDFDNSHTVYLAAQNEQGDIAGVARLLPTTTPYLLRDVFPQLMGGQPAPCSPDVWELSRFAAVDFGSRSENTHCQVSSPVAIQLLSAAVACAAGRGAKRLITVSPVGVERLMRYAGFRSHRAGPLTVVNGQPLCACWIEVDENIARIGRTIGGQAPVARHATTREAVTQGNAA